MQKPPATAAFIHRVQFGVSVFAACTRKKRTELAARAQAAAYDVKVKGRLWEDSQDATVQQIALKNGVDADLDTCAQDIRFEMARRGRNAVNEAPYTRVWYNGVEYYTGAKEAEELARYTELASLLKANLPETDPIIVKHLPRLEALLAEWTSALANKNAAEASEKQARLTLDEAQAAFDATMDQIYGTLFAELGRKGADRYFP